MAKKELNEEQLEYIQDTTQKEMLYDIAQLLYWIREDLKQLNNGNNNNQDTK